MSVEQRIKEAAENAIVNLIASGNWIAPDYSNRFKLPKDFNEEVWKLVDVESIKLQMSILIERDLAEKIVAMMAAEISSDIKKVLSDSERRESIRSVVRENLDSIIQKKG